jgi:hypothetical protein
MEKEMVELRATVRIETDDLTIETAFLFTEEPIDEARTENEAKFVPFRETSLHRPLSMNSSALNPSYFSSKK